MVVCSLQRFRTDSGETFSFNLVDTDHSSWANSSGVGAVDVEYDESGNHIETEFEFGLQNSWVASNFLRSVSRAQEYAQSPSGISFESVSGIDNLSSDSTQRWELDDISVWTSGNTSGLPSVDLQSIFNQSLSNQDIFFNTSFSGFQESDQYVPLKFEISDFTDNTINYQDASEGFDLRLIGTIQNDV